MTVLSECRRDHSPPQKAPQNATALSGTSATPSKSAEVWFLSGINVLAFTDSQKARLFNMILGIFPHNSNFFISSEWLQCNKKWQENKKTSHFLLLKLSSDSKIYNVWLGIFASSCHNSKTCCSFRHLHFTITFNTNIIDSGDSYSVTYGFNDFFPAPLPYFLRTTV